MNTDAIASSAAGGFTRAVCIAVVFTLFTAIAFGFGIYLFALIMPAMRPSIGFANAAIGMASAGAQIAYLAAALVCPMLTRRFGAGQVTVCAVAVGSLLLLAFAGIQGAWQAGVVLAGLGAMAALMIVPTVGAISKAVPFAYRSAVNGLVSSGTAYGQLANGLLVPWLLPGGQWRSIWLVTGTGSLAITLIGFVILRIIAPDVFVRETVRKRDEASGSIVTTRNFTVWILLALSGMTCGPWQNYLSSYLTEEGRLSLATVGQLWSIIGGVGLFSGLIAGMLADRIGVRVVLVASYIALACSALLIALHTQIWQLRIAAACFGLSFYAIYGMIPAYISKTVDAHAAAKIFAIANVFLGLGTALGNIMAGRVPGSLQWVFISASAIAFISMAITLTLQDERTLRHRPDR
ncbi:MFS transporter [Caballeronia sp. BR00000012568055]|uniref:MFS transporter n=1 Tax=Caballeronia sp. BR00000012568055 TaxID=2918761 RepID=UPI0023F75F4D|nr:MFS transporter [Caballeronia sp. BR00000012568055]